MPIAFFCDKCYLYIMLTNSIPDLILQETKQLPDDLLKEVLDFVLFLKSKNKLSDHENALSALQQTELKHLESEFENYKEQYPHE